MTLSNQTSRCICKSIKISGDSQTSRMQVPIEFSRVFYFLGPALKPFHQSVTLSGHSHFLDTHRHSGFRCHIVKHVSQHVQIVPIKHSFEQTFILSVRQMDRHGCLHACMDTYMPTYKHRS